jgi:hypothetical protein
VSDLNNQEVIRDAIMQNLDRLEEDGYTIVQVQGEDKKVKYVKVRLLNGQLEIEDYTSQEVQQSYVYQENAPEPEPSQRVRLADMLREIRYGRE